MAGFQGKLDIPSLRGEVIYEPPFFRGDRYLTSPRRADGVKVALHFLIGAAAPP